MIRTLLFFFILISVSACSTSESVDDSEVFETVEQMPELIGGINSLLTNATYPEMARMAGIEGKVIVEFVVDAKGNVRDASIVKGLGGGCDEEAIRVLNEHAKFTPGRQDGRAVNVKMTLPITFKLT